MGAAIPSANMIRIIPISENPRTNSVLSSTNMPKFTKVDSNTKKERTGVNSVWMLIDVRDKRPSR